MSYQDVVKAKGDTSLLFELKAFMSNRVGLLMSPNVQLSSFLISPPNMRGDLAMAHNVIYQMIAHYNVQFFIFLKIK